MMHNLCRLLALLIVLLSTLPAWAERLQSEVPHDTAIPPASMMVMTGCEAKDQDGAALPRAVSTEGDAVRCAMSLSGVLYVMPVNEDGSGIATVDTELPEAAALADGASAAPTTPTVGVIPLLMNATTVDRARAVVNGLNSTGTGIAAAGIVGQLDDTATGAVTENQFAPVRITTRRGLITTPFVSNNALADGVSNTIETPIAFDLDDSVEVSMELAVFPFVFNGTTWDRPRSGAGAVGTGVQRVVTANNDPCQTSGTAKSSVVVAVTADAQLIAASGSTIIYVCGFSVSIAGTTPTMRFIYGTGTVCATGLTALTGTYAPLTGSMILGGNGGATVFATTASQALCVDTEGTSPSVQGILTYVQQ